ncbi:MAG: alpha/beta fold hydrolase [Actinobacteria bacterium]|nr:alpha/beta fold hydrolase [Actinomycetota bacterium]
MLKRFTWATVFILGIAACGSKATASQPTDLASYQTQDFAWGKCASDYFLPADQFGPAFKKSAASCATVTVPALYSGDQSLPDFKIAMMRQPATGPKKLGTLFINPGGPGESGIKELQWTNFPAEVRKTYDIVGFDPRGVNLSAPVEGHQIKCNTQSDYETYWTGDSTPSNDAEYLANIDTSDAYYKLCSEDNPTWWTLNTHNVVDDLELMRQVITGSKPLNFLGSSYGTTIAAEYITRYPNHVGHIALDSPTTNDPGKPSDQITEAKAVEANVLRLAKGYAKAKGISLAAVKKLMLKVRQDGDNNKLKGFAGMTIGMFEYFAMYMDGYDPETLGGKTYQPDKIKRDNSYEIMTIVDSMDRDTTDKSSKAEKKKLAAKIKKVSPFWTALNSDASNYEYTGDREGIDWISMAKEDSAIPDPPTTAAARTNTSGKKVLVVGAKFESTTPYAFAIKTAADLKSPLVTFNGTGHAPLAGFDKKCLNDIFVAYFVHNKLPSGPVTCTK